MHPEDIGKGASLRPGLQHRPVLIPLHDRDLRLNPRLLGEIRKDLLDARLLIIVPDRDGELCSGGVGLCIRLPRALPGFLRLPRSLCSALSRSGTAAGRKGCRHARRQRQCRPALYFHNLSSILKFRLQKGTVPARRSPDFPRDGRSAPLFPGPYLPLRGTIKAVFIL